MHPAWKVPSSLESPTTIFYRRGFPAFFIAPCKAPCMLVHTTKATHSSPLRASCKEEGYSAVPGGRLQCEAAFGVPGRCTWPCGLLQTFPTVLHYTDTRERGHSAARGLLSAGWRRFHLLVLWLHFSSVHTRSAAVGYKFPHRLPAAQSVTAINWRTAKPLEKVVVMRPKQCSLGNEVVAGRTTSLTTKAADDSMFRSHGAHLFGFSLYFYLRGKKKRSPKCCLLRSRLLTAIWKDSQGFPVISQDGSLAIVLRDRQCVWPLKYSGCGPRLEMSEAALGPSGTSRLPWDKGKGLLGALSTGDWGFCGTAAARGTESSFGVSPYRRDMVCCREGLMADIKPGGKERSAEDWVKEKLLLTNFNFIFLSNGLFRVFFFFFFN